MGKVKEIIFVDNNGNHISLGFATVIDTKNQYFICDDIKKNENYEVSVNITDELYNKFNKEIKKNLKGKKLKKLKGE